MGILADSVKAISDRIASASGVNDPVVSELMAALARARVAAGSQSVAIARYESGTTAVAGQFTAIQCVGSANAVFSALVAGNWTGDDPSAIVLTPGSVIYGDFTAFTLASGAVVAYSN